MKNTDRSSSMLPLRPPTSLKVVALFLLFAGLFTSPDILIYLGPMRWGLTHSNQFIVNQSLTELMIYRIVSIGFSLMILIIILAWHRLLHNPIVIEIANHQPIESPRQNSLRSPFNVSFVIMMTFVVLGLIYVALGDQFFGPSMRIFINEEDGLIEQSTAFIFLVCSIMSAMISVKVSGNRKTQIVYIVLSIGFFICFGEEISWGQRIFNFETIEFLKTVNVQEENNIHNMFGFFSDRIFFGGVLLYCVILPYLKVCYPFWQNVLSITGLPMASRGLAIGFCVVLLLHNWTVYGVFLASVGLDIRELRELLVALGLFLLMWECWLTVRKDNKMYLATVSS